MRRRLKFIREVFYGLYVLYSIGRIPSDYVPEHEGATEEYGKELHAMVVERELDDTGNFDGSWLRTHCDLEDIEATAKERIGDICQLAINMLNNDVWWGNARAVA